MSKKTGLSKKENKRNLFVLAGVMLVNAISYGMLIPLLYPYSVRFGITPFSLSLLLASFSLAQFLATPIIGRLSDKYGRKPLLMLSLFGTSVSLLLFGLAQSVFMLFVSRILDGITGGNISVAQAAIADSVPEEERAQAFGILGAAFGLGFVLGPAMGGALTQFGMSIPFFFAAGIALVAVLMGQVLFKETNVHREDHPQDDQLINVRAMVGVLRAEHVGKVFWVSILFWTALNAMFIGFQTFTVDVLQLNTTQIALLFAIYGVVSVIMQMGGIRFLMQKIPQKRRLLQGGLVLSAIFLALSGFATSTLMFTIIITVFAIVSAPLGPVLTALLSERTKPEDQGGMMGLNQSYTSLSQIVGPLLAGQVAGLSLSMVFVGAGVLMLLGLVPARGIGEKRVEVDL